MRLSGIDDALELGVRQDAIGDNVGRQMRTIGWLWWRDGSHRRRLDEHGGMRLRAWNADRLQRIGLIQRIADLAGIRGNPVHRLTGDFGRDEVNCWRHRWLMLAEVGTDGSRRGSAGSCRNHRSRSASWPT